MSSSADVLSTWSQSRTNECARHILSSSTMSSSSHTDTSAPTDAPALPGTLDADVAALATALADAPADADTELSGPELTALLAQLARADGLAAGVEGRLDALIGGLDALLAGLGVDDGDGEGGAGGDRAVNGTHGDDEASAPEGDAAQRSAPPFDGPRSHWTLCR
jgi:hypothetical protein